MRAANTIGTIQDRMSSLLRKGKHEIGVSPDELIFRGERLIDKVRLRLLAYDPETLEEQEVGNAEAVKPGRGDGVRWLNVDGLHEAEVMTGIGKAFGLEKLVLAEVMNTQARPRVQEYSNSVFISIKMLQHQEPTGAVTVENLSLVITNNALISFQERAGDVFDPVRERIRAQKKRIRGSGADYLAFALLDIVVDNYIYIIGELGERIEALEDNLLIDPSQRIIDRINAYKRELNFLRKNINPAREMVLALSKLESELIADATDVHLKELVDNINQAADASNNYREILSDQLNIYHTTISSKLNDIMKFLTVFSVIFIPLTFIAGIYGTNFDVIPELHYEYSYFVMLGLMIIVAAGMLIYFRRKKWL